MGVPSIFVMTLLLLVCLSRPWVGSAERILIGFTRASPFTGTLEMCVSNPNNTAECTFGLPAALSIHRQQIAATSPDTHVFIPDIDLQSALMNVHPDGGGVSIKLLRAMNVSHYSAEPWLVSFATNNAFLTEDVTPLLTTRDILQTDEVFPYVHRYLILGDGGHTAILFAGNSREVSVTDPIGKLRVIIDYLRAKGVIHIVLLCDDVYNGADWYASSLGNSSQAVDVAIQLRASTTSTSPCTTMYPTATTPTHVCNVAAGQSTTMASMLIDTNTTGGDGGTSVTAIGRSVMSLFPNETDTQYYTHVDAVLSEMGVAINQDEVVGTTNTALPAAQPPSGVYPCNGGECAFGTLLSRVFMWSYPDADISMINAGTFQSADGWGVGNITYSQVWSAYPFQNTYCVGNITGLKIFQILDASLSQVNFNSSANDGRLLHLGNVEIDINPNLTTHRLITLRIRNRLTGVFEPLVRHQYYSFVTTNYQCTYSPDTSSLFNALLEGESKDVLGDGDVTQDTTRSYLRAHSPYDSYGLTTGYMQFVDSTDALVWSTDRVSCEGNSYWSMGILSCLDCPVGMVGTGGTTCIDAEADSSDNHHDDLIWQIGVPVFVLLCVSVGGAVAVMEWRRRRDVRSTGDAPTSGKVAVVFTDIQWSTKLWGTVPASMAVALRAHNAIIREQISLHHGYEVKTVGDSFMIAFGCPLNAVNLAASIQLALHHHEWPASVNAVYDAGVDEEQLTKIIDDPNDLQHVHTQQDGSVTGLRVRIGVNWGTMDVAFDEVTKGYDYHGPHVNIAARVEAEGSGGQTLVTKDVLDGLPPASTTDNNVWCVKDFGTVPLRGVPTPTEIHEVALVELPRTFTKNNRKKSELLVGVGEDGARFFPKSEESTNISKMTARQRFSVVAGGNSSIKRTPSSGGGGPGSSSQSHNYADNHSATITTIHPNLLLSLLPEQQLAYQCLEVFLRVATRADRDLILKTLGKGWGVEDRGGDVMMTLAQRAGHPLKRAMNASYDAGGSGSIGGVVSQRNAAYNLYESQMSFATTLGDTIKEIKGSTSTPTAASSGSVLDVSNIVRGRGGTGRASSSLATTNGGVNAISTNSSRLYPSQIISEEEDGEGSGQKEQSPDGGVHTPSSSYGVGRGNNGRVGSSDEVVALVGGGCGGGEGGGSGSGGDYSGGVGLELPDWSQCRTSISFNNNNTSNTNNEGNSYCTTSSSASHYSTSSPPATIHPTTTTTPRRHRVATIVTISCDDGNEKEVVGGGGVGGCRRKSRAQSVFADGDKSLACSLAHQSTKNSATVSDADDLLHTNSDGGNTTTSTTTARMYSSTMTGGGEPSSTTNEDSSSLYLLPRPPSVNVETTCSSTTITTPPTHTHTPTSITNAAVKADDGVPGGEEPSSPPGTLRSSSSNFLSDAFVNV